MARETEEEPEEVEEEVEGEVEETPKKVAHHEPTHDDSSKAILSELRKQNQLREQELALLRETRDTSKALHDHLTKPLDEDEGDEDKDEDEEGNEVTIVEPDPPPQPKALEQPVESEVKASKKGWKRVW